MTQEQKAKAYDEALERARMYRDNAKAVEEYSAVARYENIFPELRENESEDERIRKWLADYSSSIKATVWIHRDITCEQILEWLEKQKEQKPPVDVDPCDASWDAYYQRWLNKGYELGLDAGRKEQKQADLPAGFYYIDLNGNRYYSKEFRYGDMKLKVREPKPAWSEEDEEMLKYVIGDVNDAKQLFDTKDAIDLCDKEIAWLKSLPLRCPKSSDNWKPSEDQLNALNFAITYFMHETNYKNPTELRELYDELLKLK